MKAYPVVGNAMSKDLSTDDLARMQQAARAAGLERGHPAIVLMAGLSQSGLPLSVQFAGHYFDEARLLQVASSFERVAGFYLSGPPERQ